MVIMGLRWRQQKYLFVIRTLVLMLGIGLLQGCVTTVKTRAGLDRLTQREGLGNFYYIGSRGGFHYFSSKYFLERTKYYRFREADYPLQHTFPMTKDRSKWIPYVIDLGANTKGFRGESQEPYQMTNTTTVPTKRK